MLGFRRIRGDIICPVKDQTLTAAESLIASELTCGLIRYIQLLSLALKQSVLAFKKIK